MTPNASALVKSVDFQVAGTTKQFITKSPINATDLCTGAVIVAEIDSPTANTGLRLECTIYAVDSPLVSNTQTITADGGDVIFSASIPFDLKPVYNGTILQYMGRISEYVQFNHRPSGAVKRYFAAVLTVVEDDVACSGVVMFRLADRD